MPSITVPGSDPKVFLQISNDGGFTWSGEREASMGLRGAFSALVRWRRLGRSQNRAYRVICSEPIFVALIAVEVDVKDS